MALLRRLPTLLLAVSGCTQEFRAPTNFSSTAGASESGGGDLTIDCTGAPLAAVGAQFAYTLVTANVQGTPAFSNTGELPPGLRLDPGTGSVNGVPTAPGVYSFEVDIVDSSGLAATTTCEVTVAPALALDGPVTTCLSADDVLLDSIRAGTGDGSPIRCAHPSGPGNGRLPAGISVDADTCQVAGTVMDTRLGSWAFIMSATQSGASLYVPYCVTNPTPTPGSYTISVSHSGNPDATLVPLTRPFNPDAAIAVGAADDPLFTISQTGACNGVSCFPGYSTFIYSSPFSADTLTLAPTRRLLDDDGVAYGFTHEFHIQADPVPAAFRTRPWVVNLDLDYCLSADPDACSDIDAIAANANGFLEFSVVMLPE